MKWTATKLVLFTLIVSSYLFIGIPYYIWKTNDRNSILPSEIFQITGIVKSIKKIDKTGRYYKPKIHVEIANKPYLFRISGSSYKPINVNKILTEIQPGDEIEIDTRLKEVKRSEKKSLLNSILEWRGQPQVYGLRKNNKSYLKLKEYNSANERFNAKNFIWGIILVAFIMGQLVWILSKEDKDNKT